VVHFADFPEGLQSPSFNRVTITRTVMETVTETNTETIFSEVIPESDAPAPLSPMSPSRHLLHPVPISNQHPYLSLTPPQPTREFSPMPSLLSTLTGPNQDDRNNFAPSYLHRDHHMLDTVTQQRQQSRELVPNSPSPQGVSPTEAPDHPMGVTENTAQRQPSLQPSMEVDEVRPPSPTPSPPPTFHVDDGLLAKLSQKFTNETGELTVEQQEQLLAMCLGCIWRHRQSWDRDGLIQELIEIVNEFVEEVELDLQNEDENQ